MDKSMLPALESLNRAYTCPKYLGSAHNQRRAMTGDFWRV